MRRLGADLAAVRRDADRLARSHLLLETSHDRLDEQLQRKAHSLREAMDAVRDLALAQGGSSLAALGGPIMELFAGHCGLEIGELFAVDAGLEVRERCAVLGRPDRMRRDDPLLIQAVRGGRLAYVPAATLPDRGDDRGASRSPVLAAIPFVDTSGVTRAVLCVQAMPFLSFDKQNLDTMAMIAATLADHLTAAEAPPGDRRPLVEGARA